MCIRDRETRIALIGHSHVSLYFTRPTPDEAEDDVRGAQSDDGVELDLGARAWLINPGSVGQPRDGDPRAAWLELDLDGWRAAYRRVDYDIAGAAAAIRAARLPDS